MADLITSGSKVQIPAGSELHDIYDFQYWDEEYYQVILKGQGPKYREFKLSDLFYKYDEKTGIITLMRDFGDIRVTHQKG